MKRRLCIALIGLMAITAVGFGQSNDVHKLVVAINNAPWLPGYRAVAQKYQRDTGVAIDLRVFPMGQLVERTRSAATADQSEFDVITLNDAGSSQFYAGGLVTPFKQIDSSFTLDPEIIQYANADRWDKAKGGNSPDAPVYGMPINGNIQLLFYRCDLYKQAGLPAPKTWQDVMHAADVITASHKGLYGYAVRAQQGAGGSSVFFDFMPFLGGFGAHIFANPPSDWSVTLDSPQALDALKLYTKLATKYSPPNAGAMGQAQQIALLQSGRLLQTVVVAGAFANMDDPNSSTVVGKICYAVVPKPENGTHATATGELLQAIPHNLPDNRKRAALKFIEYLVQYKNQVAFAEAGGVPIRKDVYQSDLAQESKFRYFKAVEDSVPYEVSRPRIPQTAQFGEAIGRRINETVTGQLTPEQALHQAAQQVYDIMKKAGYTTALK